MDYAVNPLKRWKVGHKIFFVHIQGLIIELRRFKAAIQSGNFAAADQNLRRAGHLMFASAPLMAFTGDFSPAEYAEEVRPTMCPPNTIEGFSGLLSRDHRELVRLFSELRPIFMTLPSCLNAARQYFLSGGAALYEAHKFVCEKFGGGSQTSLRMNESSEKSSVDVLDIFKINRLRPMEGERARPSAVLGASS